MGCWNAIYFKRSLRDKGFQPHLSSIPLSEKNLLKYLYNDRNKKNQQLPCIIRDVAMQADLLECALHRQHPT
jgi:hypothetical protein